jgi:hypothetical protein
MFTKRGAVNKQKGVYSMANARRLNMRLGYTEEKKDIPIRGKEQLITWIVWSKPRGLFE